MLNKGYNPIFTWKAGTEGSVEERPLPEDLLLDPTSIRILGALMEKSMATPEYYPLSLNALVNACNQKNNRNPVVAFDEATVLAAIDSLKEKRLVVSVSGADHRVTKYKETFTRLYVLEPPAAAVLCVLFLRGDLTMGEIRSTTASLHAFQEIGEVAQIMDALRDDPLKPMVVGLPRRPGQKEPRYIHLLSGRPDPARLAEIQETSADGRGQLSVTSPGRMSEERIQALETEVHRLNDEVLSLRAALEHFKKQFES